MGVKDLWQLLSPIGRRISIETLEGKALAIDMSIWLTQFIKAMRDEDGKMIKNAHLIGTLRRILKLLFHRIRPLFVFDGATPSLKINVVQRRRKLHERSEANRRAALQKILLAHMKNQLKESKKNELEREKVNENDQYASSFNAPSSSSTQKTIESSAEPTLLGNEPGLDSKNFSSEDQVQNLYLKNDEFQLIDEDDNDIEWESGYENLRGKAVEEEEEGSENELEYHLPDSYQQLNIEALASLPVHMRKKIVEELRRKERIKSRQNYIPVADNPYLYSQTQLANFLQTSKLNRKVEAAQRYLDGPNEGKRIASEGNKKMLFVDKNGQVKETSRQYNNSEDDEDLEESNSEEQEKDLGTSRRLRRTKKVSFKGDQFENILDGTSSSKTDKRQRNFVEDAEEDLEEIEGPGFISEDVSLGKRKIQTIGDSSSSSRFKHRRLRKNQSTASQDREEPELEFEEGRDLSRQVSKEIHAAAIEVESEAEDNNISSVHYGENGDADYGGGGGFLLGEEEPVASSNAADRTVAVSDNFYDNLHYDDEEDEEMGNEDIREDSLLVKEGEKTRTQEIQAQPKEEQEEDLDDIAWESEEVVLESVPDQEGIEETHKPSVEDEDKTALSEPEEDDDVVIVEGTDASPLKVFSVAERIALSEEDFLPQIDSIASEMTSPPVVSTLDRAIATASNMADWAGRAVRRALKDHLPSSKTKEKEIEKEKELDTSEAMDMIRSSSSQNDIPSVKSESVVRSSSSLTANLTGISSSDRNQSSQQQQPPKGGGGGTNWNQIAERIAQAEESMEMAETIESMSFAAQETQDIELQPSKGSTTESQLIGIAEYSDEYENEEKEEAAWKKDFAKSARDSERVTEDMRNEVMELLQAFDLPYITAPFEAEAQCAVLEQLGLVDGVITEDSDAFLFGAKAIYKNIFNDKKFVEVYLADDVKRELGLQREDFIALAYFLGSDYTEGINGIGIVNAMEILQAFPFEESEEGILQGLEKFKEWIQGYDLVTEVIQQMEDKQSKKGKKVGSSVETTTKGSDVESVEENEGEEGDKQENGQESEKEKKSNLQKQALIQFDKKHRSGRSKWSIPNSFPNPRVCHAYLHPMANQDNEKFLWKYPNLTKVRNYCQKILGWTDSEMDANINPVLKKFAEKSIQTRIDQHYLTYQDDTRFARISSERLKSAVVQITGKSTDLSLLGPKRPRKRKSKEDTTKTED